MQQHTMAFSKKEWILFNIECCVNELLLLKDQLAIKDYQSLTQQLDRLHRGYFEQQQ